MKVDITTEDIRNGLRRDGKRCALALSICRALPPETTVLVGCIEAWINDRCVWLPDEAVTFVALYDTVDGALRARPLTFELPIGLEG